MTCGLHNKTDGHENHNCCDCNAPVWRYPKICERKDCYNGLTCEFEPYEKGLSDKLLNW